MARKKKPLGGEVATSAPSMPERKSEETEQVENGYIVRLTHEGKHGYQCKKYVAFSQPEAQRIAAQGMSSLSKKGGKKKASKRKMFSSKA